MRPQPRARCVANREARMRCPRSSRVADGSRSRPGRACGEGALRIVTAVYIAEAPKCRPCRHLTAHAHASLAAQDSAASIWQVPLAPHLGADDPRRVPRQPADLPTSSVMKQTAVVRSRRVAQSARITSCSLFAGAAAGVDRCSTPKAALRATQRIDRSIRRLEFLSVGGRL